MVLWTVLFSVMPQALCLENAKSGPSCRHALRDHEPVGFIFVLSGLRVHSRTGAIFKARKSRKLIRQAKEMSSSMSFCLASIMLMLERCHATDWHKLEYKFEWDISWS